MGVRIQTQDFDVGLELSKLRLTRPDTGAVVSFIGQVRDLNEGDHVSQLTLEHYPCLKTGGGLEANILWKVKFQYRFE